MAKKQSTKKTPQTGQIVAGNNDPIIPFAEDPAEKSEEIKAADKAAEENEPSVDPENEVQEDEILPVRDLEKGEKIVLQKFIDQNLRREAHKVLPSHEANLMDEEQLTYEVMRKRGVLTDGLIYAILRKKQIIELSNTEGDA